MNGIKKRKHTRIQIIVGHEIITYFASAVNGILQVGTVSEIVTKLCFRKQYVIVFWFYRTLRQLGSI